jgi:hypothetical protein
VEVAAPVVPDRKDAVVAVTEDPVVVVMADSAAVVVVAVVARMVPVAAEVSADRAEA